MFYVVCGVINRCLLLTSHLVPCVENQPNPEVGGSVEGAGLSSSHCLVRCQGGERPFPQILTFGIFTCFTLNILSQDLCSVCILLFRPRVMSFLASTVTLSAGDCACWTWIMLKSNCISRGKLVITCVNTTVAFCFSARHGHRHQKLLHSSKERRLVENPSGLFFTVEPEFFWNAAWEQYHWCCACVGTCWLHRRGR